MKNTIAKILLVSLCASAVAWAGTTGIKSLDAAIELSDEKTPLFEFEVSPSYDSLYMYRGANVVRGGKKYGHGIFTIDANVTINISENDSLNIGAWYINGLQPTQSYREFDAYVNYTRTIGNFELGLGYLFWQSWYEAMTCHELNFTLAYNWDLGFMTVRPAIIYNLGLGPKVTREGAADAGSGFVEVRVDASIPVVKEKLAIEPWVSFGYNLRYNEKVSQGWDREYFEFGEIYRRFNGANDLQLGVALPYKITEWMTWSVYGAYSYSFETLPDTRRNTLWGGTKITFSF